MSYRLCVAATQCLPQSVCVLDSEMAQACHFLWDSKGLWILSVPSLTSLNLPPTRWQAKTEGVDALHLGRPNASLEALEAETCFSTQVLLRPKVKQSPSSSSTHPKAIRLLCPPCSQQKAEGRGKAWLCGTPPAGNDALCVSTEMPT